MFPDFFPEIELENRRDFDLKISDNINGIESFEDASTRANDETNMIIDRVHQISAAIHLQRSSKPTKSAIDEYDNNKKITNAILCGSLKNALKEFNSTPLFGMLKKDNKEYTLGAYGRHLWIPAHYEFNCK